MANTTMFGFVGLEDLFSRRVSEDNQAIVYDAVTATVNEWNRTMNEIMAMFLERTVTAQENFQQPGSGTLQPLDDFGNPLPVQPGEAYQVAYPIQGAGTAWGDNRVTRQLMTVQEVNDNLADALRRDRDWVIRHFLAAVFDNVAWTFNDRVGAGGNKGLGNITVQPLANSDSVTYLRRGGAVATDNHYLAQAADIGDDSNPFPTIRRELIEHPGNSGRLVVYIPSALVDTVTALTEFVEISDPDISYGADESTVADPGAGILGPGVEVLGKTKSSNAWIAEWPMLPDEHMIAKMVGTPPGLRMREYDSPALQGLFTEFDTDGNLEENRYLRYAGIGVADRTSMLVYQVGNATYEIPTGYDAPLSV